MSDYENELSWNSGKRKAVPFKISIFQFLCLLLLPALAHFFIVYVGSQYDPCDNNPGCMAGSPTGYFAILVSVPTMVILIVATLFQVLRKRRGFKSILKTNFIISLLPFLLVFLLVTGIDLYRN